MLSLSIILLWATILLSNGFFVHVDAFSPVSPSLVGDVLLRYKKTTTTLSTPTPSTTSSSSSSSSPQHPHHHQPLEMVGTQSSTKTTEGLTTTTTTNKRRVVLPNDIDKWFTTSPLDQKLKQQRRQRQSLQTPPPPLPSDDDRTWHLRLDDHGRLRMGLEDDNDHDRTVLMDGVSNTVWSSSSVIFKRESTVVNKNKSPSSLFSSLLLQTTALKQSVETLSLGRLVNCQRFLAGARLTRYWMGPKFGTHPHEIPYDTQFLLVELEEEDDNEDETAPRYALFLPLVDGGYRATLEHHESATTKDTTSKKLSSSSSSLLDVVCYSETGGPSNNNNNKNHNVNALYIAVGNDPYELLSRGFQEVADTLQTFETLSHKNIPSTVNDFGWCTWDAYYSKVDPKGILQGIQSLKDLGVPARNLILDDGWQHVSPQPKEWNQLATANTMNDDGGESAATETLSSTRASMAPLLFTEKMGRAAFHVVASGITRFYERHVQRSHHSSLSSRLWTLMARRTLLKNGLWNYFDTETDFGRQLDSLEPNWKFQNVDSCTADNTSLTLAELVHKLKTDLDVKKVYCWHALHGYWRGVTNGLGESIGIDVTQAYTNPSKKLLRMEPQMAYDTPTLFGVGMIRQKEDLKTFYRHLHEPLVNAGVDGVKVDVQSGVSAAGSGVQSDYELARMYTQEMEQSVAERFPDGESGAVETINCMCHSTENLYRYKKTAVARASDDFYPDRPESHSVHLVNVAYNSLFLGEIALPDWDMFHSKHKSAELHAAARAIGGCPVYVSDVPGQHGEKLLKKLVLPDGSILRAQKPGRPTRDCLFADVGKDGKTALKVWNQNRQVTRSSGDASGGVIGVFNVQGVAWNFDTHENEAFPAPPTLTAAIKPHDIETLRPHQGPFAVWSHREKSFQVLPSGETTTDISLQPHEWEIFTVEPVQQSGFVKWAPIGLGDMLNSGGALLHVGPLEETTTTTNSTFGEDAGDGWWRQTTTAEIETRGPGRFVAYCQPAPSSIIVDDGSSIPSHLDFSYDDESGLLEFTLPIEPKEGNHHKVTVAWDHRR
mmetsp:Transcript_10037/g.17789  ORF Transcript_10037/g.17789 Transcript_10037/m.17789 type:complete len:1055 (-) Transcript_10037:2199-5363(-)